MHLQQTLNAMKEKFEAGLPPEVKTVMHQATADLAKSGIMDRVLQPGAKMPHFILANERENDVSSRDLIAKGPLVLSFYRGVW